MLYKGNYSEWGSGNERLILSSGLNSVQGILQGVHYERGWKMLSNTIWLFFNRNLVEFFFKSYSFACKNLKYFWAVQWCFSLPNASLTSGDFYWFFDTWENSLSYSVIKMTVMFANYNRIHKSSEIPVKSSGQCRTSWYSGTLAFFFPLKVWSGLFYEINSALLLKKRSHLTLESVLMTESLAGCQIRDFF